MKRKKRKHISQSKRSTRSSSSNSSNRDCNNSTTSKSDTCSQNADINNEQNSCNGDSSNNNNNNNSNNNDNNQNTNDNSNNQNSKLCYFSAFDYFVLSSTLAIALAEELSDTDIDILSTFLATLSDQLALIGSVNSCAQGERENIFVPPIPAGASSGRGYSTSSPSKSVQKK